MKHIYVKSEFAPLKKVVVTQSEIYFPKQFKDVDFLSEEMQNTEEIAGKSFEEAYPEKQLLWEKEREELILRLESYGVEVFRPRKLTDFEKEMNAEHGCSNFFARDPFFTIGNAVIEGSLRFMHRRNEILPVRDLLEQEVLESDAMYVSVPRPDNSKGYDSEKGPFLEGGDVLVYGKYVFVGKSGLASNDRGYFWLKHFLEPMGYEVIQVVLEPNVLHLDCAMSFVREGLMIVSEKALLNEIPEVLKDWDKISVDPEEIQYLTINGLPINEETYITDIQFKDTIGKELEKRNIKVEYIDFAISRSMGGSFRCSTQPFLRE
ncbi:MAG: amidinotransferase [bacterium]|nr:amidinotransferase [bacterium]